METKLNIAGVELNAKTLHGTHYSEESFYAIVEERAQKRISTEEEAAGRSLSTNEVKNIYWSVRGVLYEELTKCNKDEIIQWELVNSQKDQGFAVAGHTEASDENPLLAPVHGISLKDYAAMAIKLAGGADLNAVCTAMGIEPAIWDELNVVWPQRMQQDSTFTVTTLYGQYFMEGAKDPRLENLGGAVISEAGKANLEKIRTDRYFYEELNGARNAAYEYGLDGAQWILDNYGIGLGDFQAVGMEWMTAQNQNFNGEQIAEYLNYQEKKREEYAAKFAAEQGGNIADDIEF